MLVFVYLFVMFKKRVVACGTVLALFTAGIIGCSATCNNSMYVLTMRWHAWCVLYGVRVLRRFLFLLTGLPSSGATLRHVCMYVVIRDILGTAPGIVNFPITEGFSK